MTAKQVTCSDGKKANIAVSLENFKYNKERKTLSIPVSRFFDGHFNGYPREFIVRSHYTGREILFRQIGYGHPEFDEDGWDGEMSVYEPVDTCPTVSTLVISNDM